MKHIITTFGILLIHFSIIAQPCTSSMQASTFQIRLNEIAAQQGDARKLDKGLALVNQGCLLSAQVKQVAQLFGDDAYRLEFCKIAYPRTLDQANFYDVLDAFRTFSFAFRMYHEMNNIPASTSVTTTTTVVNTPPPFTYTFPQYSYPSHQYYAGAQGCSGPVMEDDRFMPLVQEVLLKTTDDARVQHIKSTMISHCLSMAQTMKLATLVNNEQKRLQLMKDVILSVHDKGNFLSAAEIFPTSTVQVEWSTYASVLVGGNTTGTNTTTNTTTNTSTTTTTTPPPPVEAVCTTSVATQKSYLKDVQEERFSSDMLAQLRLIAKENCFSTAQVREYMDLFAMGADKIEAAKILYWNCSNKKDYHQLVSALTFSSDKETLRAFIANPN
jgi:hypothetical protein